MWIPCHEKWSKIPYWSSAIYCVCSYWRPECTGFAEESRIEDLSSGQAYVSIVLPVYSVPYFPLYYTTNISICWILLSHYSHSFTVNLADELKSSVRVYQQPKSVFPWAHMNTCVVHSLCTALYTSLRPYADGYDILHLTKEP